MRLREARRDMPGRCSPARRPSSWPECKCRAPARRRSFKARVVDRSQSVTEPLTRRGTEGDLGRWKDDIPVIVEAKARIMRPLPGMAVEVKEHAGVAAVESLRRLAGATGTRESR